MTCCDFPGRNKVRCFAKVYGLKKTVKLFEANEGEFYIYPVFIKEIGSTRMLINFLEVANDLKWIISVLKYRRDKHLPRLTSDQLQRIYNLAIKKHGSCKSSLGEFAMEFGDWFSPKEMNTLFAMVARRGWEWREDFADRVSYFFQHCEVLTPESQKVYNEAKEYCRSHPCGSVGL